MSDVHYRFHPRYTAGSPGNWTSATITSGLFDRLIAEEKRAHEHYIEGVYGEPAQKAAKTVGLSGIAETRVEAGRGKLRGWRVRDLITDESMHLTSEAMRDHEQRQHARVRHILGKGECRWCRGGSDLSPDESGDLVCGGCFEAMKWGGGWSTELAVAFRKQREGRKP